MEPFVKAAGEFLKAIGCAEITLRRSADPSVVRFAAKFKDTPLVARVQVKPEWGSDLPTSIGTNWKDGRYPFKSVQFMTPTPLDGETAYTHYVLVAGSGDRLVVAPKSVIDAAPNGWLRQAGQYVQTAVVENWTPKVGFFRREVSGWEKDAANIWTKPVKVSMDPDEFLASLG